MMLPELLTECYLTKQPWQEFFMPRADAISYFIKMIDRGNIISICDNDQLLGYCEFWRINYEQMGRLVCKAPFWTLEENTTDGNICFVANVWIAPDRRRGLVFKALENVFFRLNHNCEWYCGFAWRKSTKPVKVFRRDKLKSELFNHSVIA